MALEAGSINHYRLNNIRNRGRFQQGETVEHEDSDSKFRRGGTESVNTRSITNNSRPVHWGNDKTSKLISEYDNLIYLLENRGNTFEITN